MLPNLRLPISSDDDLSYRNSRNLPIHPGSGPLHEANPLSPQDDGENSPGAHECPEDVDPLQHVHHVGHVPVLENIAV